MTDVYVVFSAAADSAPAVNSVYAELDDAREMARQTILDYGYDTGGVAYARLQDLGIVDDAESRPVEGPVWTNDPMDVAIWVERHSVL